LKEVFVSVDLSEFTESLEREVTPLGTTLFSAVTDTQWIGYMTDAFWEARLDGFLEGYVVDEDGIVEPESGDVDMDRKWVALVVLYAGIKVLRNKILNTQTTFRAKAGPVEFEQGSSATMLAEMLKQLKSAKDRILDQIDHGATETLMVDALSVRIFSPGSYFGDVELTG
jgi:hypothetical protein